MHAGTIEELDADLGGRRTGRSLSNPLAGPASGTLFGEVGPGLVVESVVGKGRGRLDFRMPLTTG